MTKLYKSKLATTPHIVSAYKLRDFLSSRESIEETGKSYAYVAQRQEYIPTDMLKLKSLEKIYKYQDDTDYEPFIMAEDIFEEAYSVLEA